MRELSSCWQHSSPYLKSKYSRCSSSSCGSRAKILKSKGKHILKRAVKAFRGTATRSFDVLRAAPREIFHANIRASFTNMTREQDDWFVNKLEKHFLACLSSFVCKRGELWCRGGRLLSMGLMLTEFISVYINSREMISSRNCCLKNLLGCSNCLTTARSFSPTSKHSRQLLWKCSPNVSTERAINDAVNITRYSQTCLCCSIAKLETRRKFARNESRRSLNEKL